MAAPPVVPAGEHVPTADQRLVTYNVPWSHYEAQLALRGDAPVPRMACLEGALELMRPSKDHERIESYLGRLLEAYALDRGIDLSPYGAWTLKNAPKQSGAEPDECYIVGSDQDKQAPDLAIEVVWTSGGIDKREIYRRLGIGEVWFWQEGRIDVYALQQDPPSAHGGPALRRDESVPANRSERVVSRPRLAPAVLAARPANGAPGRKGAARSAPRLTADDTPS